MFHLFSGNTGSAQVYQHQMIIGAVGDNVYATLHQSITECSAVLYYLFLINTEFWLQSFLEADCLSCDHMHQRTTLNTWENSFIKVEFLSNFIAAQDHTTSWATQGLVSGSGCYMCVWDWTWMETSSNQTCNMGDIYHQISTHFIGNLTESLEINGAGIGAGTCND